MPSVTTRLAQLRALSAPLKSDAAGDAERDLEALIPSDADGRGLTVVVGAADAMTFETPAFLTVQQVANTVGLHHKVVRRAIDAGELRAFKLRRRVRIKRTDFEAWVEANRVEPYPIPELQP
jgi:excisionase family DNA binding protein